MERVLTGEQKAAIFLMAIGEEAASHVMRYLDPKDIRRIGVHMTSMSNIPKAEERLVLKEFDAAAREGEISLEGKEYIRTILQRALGNEKASRIMETLTATTYPGLESLKWLDAKSLAQLVRTEHPQTIAVILAYVDPEQGSQVLKLLPDHLRPDVAHRLATMDQVDPQVLQHLSEVLQETTLAGGGARSESIGGPKLVADMIARLDKSTEGSIMEVITQRAPTLADNIRALMFVFDDLVKLDDRAMQELMKEVNKEDLPLALKAASPDVRDKFFKNMSTRAAQMLQEDMEARGPVRVAEVQKAQQNILGVCKKLEQEGRIVVGGKGEDLV
jgi:flagellar motor switch protein FliG